MYYTTPSAVIVCLTYAQAAVSFVKRSASTMPGEFVGTRPFGWRTGRRRGPGTTYGSTSRYEESAGAGWSGLSALPYPPAPAPAFPAMQICLAAVAQNYLVASPNSSGPPWASSMMKKVAGSPPALRLTNEWIVDVSRRRDT
jgi:hypothetical protein